MSNQKHMRILWYVVAASSFFPIFSFFLNFAGQFFLWFLIFWHFSIFRPYSSLVEIRSPRVRKGTLVILWFGRAGGRACARVPLRSCDLMFGFDFVWIMDQGSWIKYQGSSILDLGPWTWHEWPSWTGYRLEIKTIRIYYQRSIILYRFYKDTIK